MEGANSTQRLLKGRRPFRSINKETKLVKWVPHYLNDQKQGCRALYFYVTYSHTEHK